jgi:hypothetical protein
MVESKKRSKITDPKHHPSATLCVETKECQPLDHSDTLILLSRMIKDQ